MPGVDSGKNEIGGNVGGLVVQAGNVDGDVHINQTKNLLEFRKAVIVAGALFGLTASSAPAGVVMAVDPPADIVVASSTMPATTLPPTTATFAPVVTSTSRPTAESRPVTTVAVPTAAVPTVEPDHHYTSAPDLSGAWELDFTMPGADKPDRYTITLKRLADSKCEGQPPCYGGQWFYAGEPKSNNAVMWASPAPTGFTAADNDLTYRATVVEDDTRRPLSYRGTWTADGGKHGVFVFTRVA